MPSCVPDYGDSPRNTMGCTEMTSEQATQKLRCKASKRVEIASKGCSEDKEKICRAKPNGIVPFERQPQDGMQPQRSGAWWAADGC